MNIERIENPVLIKWNEMKDAPRDGSWILLDIEDGSTDLSDMMISSVYVGRWNPKVFQEIGPHTYEWEIIVRYPDDRPNDPYAGEITNHYSDGRVSGWLPLPE